MEAKEIVKRDQINVLVIGNNPIELGELFQVLSKVQGKHVVSEIAFDLKSAMERLGKIQLQFILIDDNIGRHELKSAMKAFSSDRRTREVPITVLKNSNYQEAIENGVLNYVLKRNLTGESLYNELLNSLRFKKTQQYLIQAYNKRKGQLARLLRPNPAV